VRPELWVRNVCRGVVALGCRGFGTWVQGLGFRTTDGVCGACDLRGFDSWLGVSGLWFGV